MPMILQQGENYNNVDLSGKNQHVAQIPHFRTVFFILIRHVYSPNNGTFPRNLNKKESQSGLIFVGLAFE